MRIALLTTGLRPAALRFGELPGEPVGIVDWDAPRAPGWRDRLEGRAARRLIAALRRREHASLAHACEARGLRHARLDKRDGAALARTLTDWRIDLAITSGCAMVPMEALANLSVGAINLHPSALPEWRGAEPLLWQLADGAPRIGASVHRLAAGSDTGPILGRADMACPAGLGRRRLSDAVDAGIGVPLLADVVAGLIEDPGRAGEAQPGREPHPLRPPRAPIRARAGGAARRARRAHRVEPGALRRRLPGRLAGRDGLARPAALAGDDLAAGSAGRPGGSPAPGSVARVAPYRRNRAAGAGGARARGPCAAPGLICRHGGFATPFPPRRARSPASRRAAQRHTAEPSETRYLVSPSREAKDRR